MSCAIGKKLLFLWHKMLGLPRQSPPSWYENRLLEELKEYRAAETPLEKLSEKSDVFFAISRAKYDGFPIRELPALSYHHIPVYAYMIVKYSLRWGFYRMAALLSGAPYHRSVREVVNPGKDHKLGEVASRHHIDQEKFKRIGRKLRRVWPLLP